MKVIKRDGTVQLWDFNKILNAVTKAFDATGDYLSEKFIDSLTKEFQPYVLKNKDLAVEDIHNIIQNLLIKKNKFTVVDSFIRWRKDREETRESKSDLINDIHKALWATNIQNQNANVDEASFGGRIGEAGRVVCKKEALRSMRKQSKRNHENNQVYIHDLDSWAAGMHNCLSVPFDHLLRDGFKTRQCNIRGARSVNTAFQLVAVIFQIQSLQQFGGVSATHLDWTMVPYVRYSFEKHYLKNYCKTLPEFDKLDILGMTHHEHKKWVEKQVVKFFLEHPNITDEDFTFDETDKFDSHLRQCALSDTKDETYQAVEGMYHNLNSLQSRSGNQLPFSSINYGTCTLKEGRMVTKALLESCIEGTGPNHDTSIFPCGIFQYMKGVNAEPGTPNYDLKRLAIESLTKRIYPNFANVDWSGNAGYDKNDPRTYFSTMGCRTANGLDINGLGQLKDGRGNICPVTVILPTLAMEVISRKYKHLTDDYSEMIKLAHENREEVFNAFLTYLEKKMSEGKDTLIERFNHIASQPIEAAKFMWENNTMAGYVPEEGPISALKHGTLALGQIALAETLEILIGENQCYETGMEYGKRIEQLFKDKCAEWKQEYKLNFGVYYTPAENLCKTAYNNFVKKYGFIEGVTAYSDAEGNLIERGYFTNSIHVPVWEQVDPFTKIYIESQLTGYSSAGCITYVELDDGTFNNIDGVERIIDFAMEHDIPYFAINIPLDTCMDCGHTGKFDVCPVCGSTKIRHLRRITGYLSTDVKNFNLGKQKEEGDRVKHSGKIIYMSKDYEDIVNHKS